MKRPTPTKTRLAAKDIGESVTTWRKLRGLTMQQLADKANASRATISRLENGDPSVSFETVLNVATMLGIMDRVIDAFDPFETDYGRLRAEEELSPKGETITWFPHSKSTMPPWETTGLSASRGSHCAALPYRPHSLMARRGLREGKAPMRLIRHCRSWQVLNTARGCLVRFATLSRSLGSHAH